MKRHLDDTLYRPGRPACTPNIPTRVGRREAVTADPKQVTCEKCQRIVDHRFPEVSR